jgi:hypothetical protein
MCHLSGIEFHPFAIPHWAAIRLHPIPCPERRVFSLEIEEIYYQEILNRREMPVLIHPGASKDSDGREDRFRDSDLRQNWHTSLLASYPDFQPPKP